MMSDDVLFEAFKEIEKSLIAFKESAGGFFGSFKDDESLEDVTSEDKSYTFKQAKIIIDIIKVDKIITKIFFINTSFQKKSALIKLVHSF